MILILMSHEFSASRVKTLLNYFCFPVAHIGYDQKWSKMCPCLRWPLLSSGITGSISLRRRSSAPNSHCGWSWGRSAPIEVNRCCWTSRPFASGCWWAPCWWSWTCSWLAGMGQQLDMVRTCKWINVDRADRADRTCQWEILWFYQGCCRHCTAKCRTSMTLRSSFCWAQQPWSS